METIRVERVRESATKGFVYVTFDGQEVAKFDDAIRLIEDDQEYYGEIINGYAGIMYDGFYIETVLRRFTPELVAVAEQIVANENPALADGFTLKNVYNSHVIVYYKDKFLTELPYVEGKESEYYYLLTQVVFAYKIQFVVPGQVLDATENVVSDAIESVDFELLERCEELHVYYKDVYITTYEVTGEVIASHYINLTKEIYREKIERIKSGSAR